MSFPKSPELDMLFESILALESAEECEKYFEDLCTIKELQSMAQRLEIARRLKSGCSYQRTVELTGASSATVGRVNRCLAYGAGGYDTVLQRLPALEEEK